MLPVSFVFFLAVKVRDSPRFSRFAGNNLEGESE